MTKKILIVEDEEDIVELLSAIFDELDKYQTFYARDGEEALRIAQVNRPDIIVLDIQLPKASGHEVCKSVKSDPSMSQIKILVLSGMAQNPNWQNAQEAWADGYITKPFSSMALLEKVEELLRSN